VKLERLVSVRARIVNWQEAVSVFQKNPILGVGFNTYSYRRINKFYDSPVFSHAQAGGDNSFLFILATTGIVGFVSYLSIWINVFLITIRMKSNVNKIVRLSSFTAIFIHSLFVNTLFYPWIMLWMWIVLGATEKIKARM